MRFTKAKHRLFVLCTVCCGFTGIGLADTLPPIWFPATGTAITSWDDQALGVGFYTLSIPFGFNFLGNDYTSAILSSNGLIYFSPPSTTPPTTPQPQASPSGFTQGVWPLIAPAWYNIQDISGSGSVLVDTMSDRVVITFEQVSSYALPGGAAPSDLATFQVSLDRDGSIIFAYQALNSIGMNNTLVGSNQAIVGVTGGLGAPDPSVNLAGVGGLALSPGFVYTSTDSTVYQTINNLPTPDGSQFAGLDLIFTPQVGLTWRVTSDFPGDPAPEPSTLLEITLSAATLLIWRGRVKDWFRGRI
jgi:hypothetical protein